MLLVDGHKIEINHFHDGAILLKYDAELSSVKDGKIGVAWFFENNEEMVALMYITRHLQSKGFKEISLTMPYIPNARQDRVKTSADVFTLKYFAEFINSLGFSSVVVLDPHSYVSSALINNICAVKPCMYIEKAVEKINAELHHNPTLMFYPDEGAMKRYSGEFLMPYAFGIKKRDWETGHIKQLDIAGATKLIDGATVLIVDDISSKGGTFLHSAKRLKELGADKIYLFVSHCENTILDGDLLGSGLIEKVFTTNSLFTASHEKIEVIPL